MPCRAIGFELGQDYLRKAIRQAPSDEIEFAFLIPMWQVPPRLPDFAALIIEEISEVVVGRFHYH